MNMDSPDPSRSCDLSVERLSLAEKNRLTEILDRYLSSLEAGVPHPQEELLAANPDLAGPLAKYLRSLDELHDVAAGFEVRRTGPCGVKTRRPRAREGGSAISACCERSAAGGMGIVYEAQQYSWTGA